MVSSWVKNNQIWGIYSQQRGFFADWDNLRNPPPRPVRERNQAMPSETICKTVRQYSRFPIPPEDMSRLVEIGADYHKVKNYVYDRYGGIGSLGKLYPGYTVQNEMTKSGLRAQLGLPSVYFYLAIFEALGEIKSQWSRTKAKVLELTGKNENFTPEEKHYLRFLLRVGNAFEAVLNEKPVSLPKEILRQFEDLKAAVDPEKLNRYLCRQVRKYHVKPHTDGGGGFSVSERAYRYGDCQGHPGIYLSTKEKRKRIFVALTDKNQYKSQIHIKPNPKESSLEIHVPVETTVRRYEDYVNPVGLSIGVFTMATTDQGHEYGEKLGIYQTEYAEWIRSRQASYSRNHTANPGRKKYEAQKRRYTERLHGYINQELNRFFRTEKPRILYAPQSVRRNQQKDQSHRLPVAERLHHRASEAEMPGTVGGAGGSPRKGHQPGVQQLRSHGREGRRPLHLPKLRIPGRRKDQHSQKHLKPGPDRQDDPLMSPIPRFQRS